MCINPPVGRFGLNHRQLLNEPTHRPLPAESYWSDPIGVVPATYVRSLPRIQHPPDMIQPEAANGWAILSDGLYDQSQEPGRVGNTCSRGQCGPEPEVQKSEVQKSLFPRYDSAKKRRRVGGDPLR